MNIKVFSVGPFMQNTLVISSESECILLDPGFIDSSISDYISQEKLKVIGIIGTHAHLDHVGAVSFYMEKYKVEFSLSEKELPVLDYAPTSAAQYGFPFSGIPEISRFLKENDTVTVGSSDFSVIETPGHTPGGICFYKDGFLLAGDTLFAGSIGRTDLPGGDHETILKSLEILKKLPDETVVYCGHGPETTIGREKKSNPYLN